MPAQSNRPATLHDVASIADVSYQTVSRVVNNHPNVADETRERVLKAIKKLEYRPNRAARSLITGSSQSLQIISFNLSFYKPIRAFVQTASSYGYHLGVSTLRNPASEDEFHVLLDELTSRMVDGFLLFEPPYELDNARVSKMCRGAPFVQIGASPSPMIPAVVFDQRHGVEQVMEHLFDLGHRQIAEIHTQTIYDGRKRHQTYLEMMHTHSLEPGPSEACNYSTPEGYQAALRLLERSEKFTAIVCGNDEVALGTLRALHERGIRVPEDVSVIGFDDNVDVPYYEPPLTTVRQDFEAQSRQGLQYLITLIEKPETPRYQQIIYPQLIVRQSTRAIG